MFTILEFIKNQNYISRLVKLLKIKWDFKEFYIYKISEDDFYFCIGYIFSQTFSSSESYRKCFNDFFFLLSRTLST